MSAYSKLITDIVGQGITHNECVMVEDMMRADFGTLDHLDRPRFRREGRKALKCIRTDQGLRQALMRFLGLSNEEK